MNPIASVSAFQAYDLYMFSLDGYESDSGEDNIENRNAARKRYLEQYTMRSIKQSS